MHCHLWLHCFTMTPILETQNWSEAQTLSLLTLYFTNMHCHDLWLHRFTMTPNLETQNWSEKKYVFFTKCWDTFIVFYLFSVRCVIWFSYLIRVAAAISGLCYPSGIFGFAPLSRSIRKIRDHCIQCMQWSLAKYLCGHFLQPQTRVRIKGNTADNCYPRS